MRDGTSWCRFRRYATWEEFNAHLLVQCQKRRERKLRGHQQTIGERFDKDKREVKLPLGRRRTVRSLRQTFDSSDVDGTGALSRQRLFGAGRGGEHREVLVKVIRA